MKRFAIVMSGVATLAGLWLFFQQEGAGTYAPEITLERPLTLWDEVEIEPVPRPRKQILDESSKANLTGAEVVLSSTECAKIGLFPTEEWARSADRALWGGEPHVWHLQLTKTMTYYVVYPNISQLLLQAKLDSRRKQTKGLISKRVIAEKC